jgi:hypothetical protein
VDVPVELILLRFLHIGLATTWIALPLGIVSAVKLGQRAGAEALQLAVAMAKRRTVAASLVGLLTILTGLVAIFYRGGFTHVQPQIHAALGLAVVLLLLGATLPRSAADKLGALAASGRHQSPEASALVRRLVMLSGIMQTLWTVILLLMLWH